MTDAELAALEQRIGETKFHADWALAFKELFAAVRHVRSVDSLLTKRIHELDDRIVALERGTVAVKDEA